jgi:hypothetical protein
MRVRGAEASDPVEVNGTQVAVLNNTFENNGGFQKFPVPVQVLRLGQNVITIESIFQEGRNFDDFEISEVQLTW